jgi:hypothetical protein
MIVEGRLAARAAISFIQSIAGEAPINGSSAIAVSSTHFPSVFGIHFPLNVSEMAAPMQCRVR